MENDYLVIISEVFLELLQFWVVTQKENIICSLEFELLRILKIKFFISKKIDE